MPSGGNFSQPAVLGFLLSAQKVRDVYFDIGITRLHQPMGFDTGLLKKIPAKKVYSARSMDSLVLSGHQCDEIQNCFISVFSTNYTDHRPGIKAGLKTNVLGQSALHIQAGGLYDICKEMGIGSVQRENPVCHISRHYCRVNCFFDRFGVDVC